MDILNYIEVRYSLKLKTKHLKHTFKFYTDIKIEKYTPNTELKNQDLWTKQKPNKRFL